MAWRWLGGPRSASVLGIAVNLPENRAGTACGNTKLGSRSGLFALLRYRVHQLVSRVSCVRFVSLLPIRALLTPVAVLPSRARNASRFAGAAPFDIRYALRKVKCVISSSVLSWMYWGKSLSSISSAVVYAGIPVPPDTSLSWIPPSSLYWIQKSLSRISAAAAKRSSAASPLLSLPLPLLSSSANRLAPALAAPADANAFFMNQRRFEFNPRTICLTSSSFLTSQKFSTTPGHDV